MRREFLEDLVLLAVRILIAALFVYDATLLFRFPADNAAFMARYGVPTLLLYPTAVFQFAGGLMIVAGLAFRPTALAFSGFCLLTAAIFHHDASSPSELIAFGKDIGLAAGYLCLFVHGPGAWSVDGLVRAARQQRARVA